MTAHIFTYGSLMFAEVWQEVVRNSYASLPGSAPHLMRKKIIGDCYPVAFPQRTAEPLHGLIYLNVNCLDILRLDKFEGEYYRRHSIIAQDQKGNKINADVYILRPRYRSLASARDWSASEFKMRYLARFKHTYMKSKLAKKNKSLANPYYHSSFN